MEPTLMYGESGDWVRYLQEQLAAAGLDPGAIDGDFGARTSAAVIELQQARGLIADGVVGPLTWEALAAAAPWPEESAQLGDWSDPGEPAQADMSDLFGDWNDPAGTTHPVLARGDRGEWVRYLQQCLAAVGHDPGAADGDFGGRTEAAVQSFQGAAGLSVTGAVDEPTWAALVPGPDGFGDSGGCKYEPGEVNDSAGDGQADVSTGVIPNALDEANEAIRATVAFDLGVPVEELDAKLEAMRQMGLPVPEVPPPFTPALTGSFVLSGFTVAEADLKPSHVTMLSTLVDKLKLNTETPLYRVLRIDGFTDCAGGFTKNVGIRMARAQATRAGLIAAGALEANVGPAVASTDAALISDQGGREGRAANRAALGVLDLVQVSPPTPKPDMPDHSQPTCQQPSDQWSYTTVGMGGAGLEFFGAQGLVIKFHNHRTGCTHWGLFTAFGFQNEGLGASLSIQSTNPVGTLMNEVFSFELGGEGVLSFVEGGAIVGFMKGSLTMGSGAMAGHILDVGGWQFQTPGLDLGLMPGRLEVLMDGSP